MWSFFPFPFSSPELCPPAVPQRHLQHFSSASNLPSHPLGCGRSRPFSYPTFSPLQQKPPSWPLCTSLNPHFFPNLTSALPSPPFLLVGLNDFMNSPKRCPLLPVLPVLPVTPPWSSPSCWRAPLAPPAHRGPLRAAQVSPRGETLHPAALCPQS